MHPDFGYEGSENTPEGYTRIYTETQRQVSFPLDRRTVTVTCQYSETRIMEEGRGDYQRPETWSSGLTAALRAPGGVKVSGILVSELKPDPGSNSPLVVGEYRDKKSPKDEEEPTSELKPDGLVEYGHFEDKETGVSAYVDNIGQEQLSSTDEARAVQSRYNALMTEALRRLYVRGLKDEQAEAKK